MFDVFSSMPGLGWASLTRVARPIGKRRSGAHLPLSIILSLAVLAVGVTGMAAAPIVIEGDNELEAIADRGTGTAVDPYVIEGIELDASELSGSCLVMRNVDSHFLFRACHFRGARDAAIALENVNHGWFVDCVVERCGVIAVADDRCADIVFTGNSFRGCRADVRGPRADIEWDDGFLGNYWDSYTGVDANGDGIGDQPYPLRAEEDKLGRSVDRFPLTTPIAGAAIEEGHYLLHVSYSKGDTFELVYSSFLVETVEFLFSVVTSTTESEMVLAQQVLASPGNGLFTIEEVIVRDEGTVRINGIPDIYASAAGTTSIKRIHRLGAVPEPGFGMISANVVGIGMSAQLPACPVAPGDQWSASWTVDADALGMDEGEQLFDAVFTFDRIESLDGERCAVIEATNQMTASGEAFDPEMGVTIHMQGEGSIETILYASLESGRILRQDISGAISITASAYGMQVFAQSYESEATLRDASVGAPGETVGESEDARSVAWAAFEEGMGLLLAGQYRAAELSLTRSASLFEEAEEAEQQANALFGVGMAMMYQERLEEAVPVLAEARELFHSHGTSRDEAAACNQLGLCYRHLGEHDLALVQYECALELSEGDPGTESTAWLNIGVCRVGMGDYSIALEALTTARMLKIQTGDVDGEIRALINMGLCLRKLGQYDRALASYEQALALCEAPTQRPFEALGLLNRGACLMELGFYEEAEESLREARDVAGLAGDPCLEAGTWITTANLQRKTGNPAGAWASLQHASSLCGTADIMGSVSYVRGWCLLDLGEAQSAVEYFEDALSWTREGGDVESEWRTKWGLARAYRILGQADVASSWYQQAIGDVEAVRSVVVAETPRATYFESVRDLYEDYIQFLFEVDPSSCCLLAERCRARTFLDMLQEASIEPMQLVSLEAGLSSGSVDAVAVDASFADAQTILQENEAVIEYMVTDNGVFVWVVTANEISDPIYVDYTRTKLMDDVIVLRQELESVDPGTSGIHTVLGLLYEKLVQPALVFLGDGVDTLIFIPSGPLWYVPFSSLTMTDHPDVEIEGGTGLFKQYRPMYLLEAYTLAFLPSLAALPALMDAETTVPETSLLILANPTLTTDQIGDLGINTVYFDTLEEAARAFALCYVGSDESVHTDADAQEARAYGLTGPIGVEVYACHGSFNSHVPLQSRLLLGPGDEVGTSSDDDPRVPDGNYHAWEAMLTDHHGAELVVLAACETLLPAIRDLGDQQLERIVTGDEVVGLARAFLSSGAQSVLGTLWQANPRAVERLLITMCGYHRQGMTWAQSLGSAQQELMAHPDYGDVWFWAPYQLMGRWR